jgi:hypothetical protein
MGVLLAERGFVEPFIVATIVGEYRSLVCCRKLQLRSIRATQILRIPYGDHFKPMWAQQLGDKDRHIFIEVQPDKEGRLGHWRRG